MKRIVYLKLFFRIVFVAWESQPTAMASKPGAKGWFSSLRVSAALSVGVLTGVGFATLGLTQGRSSSSSNGIQGMALIKGGVW